MSTPEYRAYLSIMTKGEILKFVFNPSTTQEGYKQGRLELARRAS